MNQLNPPNSGVYQTRRSFLIAGGALALVGPLASQIVKTASASEKISEPLEKFWPVTCRDVMLRRSGAPTCWAAMDAYGVDGVESDITDDLSLPALYGSETPYSVATPEKRAELRAALERVGKRITAFCMHNRFEERPEFEIEWGTKVALAAQELHVRAVRIDVVPRKMPRAEFLELAATTLQKLLAATEKTGVRFAIENHGNTTNDPEFLDALFNRVNSPRLGLTLDTANFYWFGHPLSRLYEIYEHFAERVYHTHCKSIAYPAEVREKQRPMGWEYAKYHCPIYQGDIDFKRVVSILKKAGYDNDLCIENEGLSKLTAEQAVSVVSQEVKFLRTLQQDVA